MQTILQIIFADNICYIKLLQQKESALIEKRTQSLPCDIENKETLSLLFSELKSYDIKKTRIIVSISQKHIMIQDAKLDVQLTDADVMLFIKSQSEKWFGHPVEQLCIDYTTQQDSENKKQKIKVVAAHATFISEIEKLFLPEKIHIDCINIVDDDKINLLPWRKKIAVKQKQKWVFYFLGFLVLTVFIFIFLKYLFAYETKLLDVKSKKIQSTAKKIILNHPHQTILLLQKIKSLSIKKIAAKKDNDAIENLLLDISNMLPNNITLNSLTITNQEFILTGFCNQLSDIHQYADYLRKALKWKTLKLSNIQSSTKNNSQINFTIQATHEQITKK